MITLRKILCLIVLLISVGLSQDSDYKSIFEQAKQYYRAENYDSTIVVIQRYLAKNGREKSNEQIVPLLMEAVVRKSDWKTFYKLYSIFVRRFPESVFISRINYLKGYSDAQQKKYKDAIIAFSECLNTGAGGTLDSLAYYNVKKIFESSVTLSDANELSSRSDLNVKITSLLINCLYDFGQVEKANKLAEKSGQRSLQQQSAENKDAINTGSMNRSEKEKTSRNKTIKVGVLAPLTEGNSDIGKYMVKGVQIAVESYNKNYIPSIDLIIYDTKGNLIETAKKMHELLEINKVDAIIGPALSSCATVAAAMMIQNPEVIMITPTATDDGIAELSHNVFQLNITAGVLSRSIARYAVDNLQIKEFAIITPLSEYGKTSTILFKEEVKRLGAKIVAEESFEEGTSDFKIQFESLRKKLAEAQWKKTGVENSMKSKDKALYLTDSTIDIGGLFIPAESEDVVKIAAQVYFYRIRSQLLGSNGWRSNTTIMDGKQYVNNALFSDSYEINSQDQKWLNFSQLYKNRFNEAADKIISPLGYDAAGVLCSIFIKSRENKSLADELRNISGYNGVTGIISFNNGQGVNTEVEILKISGKKFVKVQ